MQRWLPHWPSILAYLRDGSADWKPKVLFVLAVVYLLVPFDLIPDLAPIIGWLDDLGGVTIATLYVLSASRRYESALRERR